MNIKGQGHSLNFVQGHSDSTFSILFCSETARPIEAKFQMEPPWDVGNENLFKCSRSHDHAHINYGEKLQKYFSLEPRGRWLWNLVYSIGYSRTIFHMMTLGWPWLFLWQGQICFRMFLHGWKLIQHWVLMYFHVCSNSTYPQHSGERYRISGPLVFKCFPFLHPAFLYPAIRSMHPCTRLLMSRHTKYAQGYTYHIWSYAKG